MICHPALSLNRANTNTVTNTSCHDPLWALASRAIVFIFLGPYESVWALSALPAAGYVSVVSGAWRVPRPSAEESLLGRGTSEVYKLGVDSVAGDDFVDLDRIRLRRAGRGQESCASHLVCRLPTCPPCCHCLAETRAQLDYSGGCGACVNGTKLIVCVCMCLCVCVCV